LASANYGGRQRSEEGKMKLPRGLPTLGLFLLLSLFLAGGARAAPPGAPPGPAGSPGGGAEVTSLPWQIEAVDAPKWFADMGPHSLVLGIDGHPRIAYGSDHLYYARYDGTTWWHTTVDDSPGVGQYASMALDPSGHPQISYYDAAYGDLRLASQVCTPRCQWYVTVVDSAGDIGQYSALAIDSAGYPHISYYYDGWLNYAHFNGTSWQMQHVDTGGDVGQYTSLALDSSGHPHISYYGSSHLKYAQYDGTTWHVETVDSSTGVGLYTSLALDSSGRPHISYYYASNRDLMVVEVRPARVYLPVVSRGY
jgi:hypothetical protein